MFLFGSLTPDLSFTKHHSSMVLDPMTGEEQEPQDLRIVIAHKVNRQLSALWKRSPDMA